MAVWDAARIRVIWRRHYAPLPKGYDTPEEVAARRWFVDVEGVHKWKKNRRCPKDPSPRTA